MRVAECWRRKTVVDIEEKIDAGGREGEREVGESSGEFTEFVVEEEEQITKAGMVDKNDEWNK